MRFISWLKGSLDGVDRTGSEDSAPTELNQFTKREKGSVPEPAPLGEGVVVGDEADVGKGAMGGRGRSKAMLMPTSIKSVHELAATGPRGKVLQQADRTAGGA
ncbi:hypothetical protein CyaNS01_02956 [Cyanobium sp. NS01]|nr:hypothetical protein CyaNS01_02956 [Cyanobium sp. NS01]